MRWERVRRARARPGRGGVVDDDVIAAGLQRREDRPVDRRHHLGRCIVHVMVVLRGPDDVGALYRRIAEARDDGDVAVGRVERRHPRRAGRIVLGGDRRDVGDDAAARLDRDGEQAGEITVAGDEIDDLLAGLDVGEGKHRGGFAVGVARDVGGGAVGVGDRHGRLRAGGGAPGEQGGKQAGGRTAHRVSPHRSPCHYATGAPLRRPIPPAASGRSARPPRPGGRRSRDGRG